jgi:hypothetical protein
VRRRSFAGVAAVAAAVVVTPALSSVRAPQLACSPGTSDVACRVSPSLYITPPNSSSRTSVTSSSPVVLRVGTIVAVLSKGTSNIFFKNDGICATIDPGVRSGTVIKTRVVGYLFEQDSGKSICSLRGGYTIIVLGSQGVRRSSALRPVPSPGLPPSPSFFAVVDAQTSSPVTQVRIDDEGNKVAIASLSGSLAVRLSSDEVDQIAPNNGLSIALTPNNAIASVAAGSATFTPAEQRAATTQLETLQKKK